MIEKKHQKAKKRLLPSESSVLMSSDDMTKVKSVDPIIKTND